MNAGVVGVGYWGTKVLEEYAALRDDGELDRVAAFDLDESRLEAATDADDAFTDIDSLLESVDAIHVCTNNQTHFDIAMAAMDRNVDVLVEKPLTTDRDRAFDLVERASESGQILQTGHVFRFANVVRTLRDLVDEGYFGEIQYYNVAWTHQIEPRDDGDVLWDLIVHPLDILNFVSGAWPNVVGGTVGSFRRDDVNEVSTIQLADETTRANIQVSWVDPVRRRLFQVVGSERSAVAACAAQEMTVYEDGESFRYDVTPNNTIRTEAENFLDAIETRRNTFNSAIVGARIVDLIQEIHAELDA